VDKIVLKYNVDARRIFNVDETALSTVQKPQKVLARRGEYQAGAMTSAERGTDTICIFYMGFAGMFVPSLLMFKRIRCKFELSTRVSPGTLFAYTENGCITSDFLFSTGVLISP